MGTVQNIVVNSGLGTASKRSHHTLKWALAPSRGDSHICPADNSAQDDHDLPINSKYFIILVCQQKDAV
jgi:hypothetical protein